MKVTNKQRKCFKCKPEHTGVYGALVLFVVLWPMYFIPIPKDGVLGEIALGPHGRWVVSCHHVCLFIQYLDQV